MQISMKERRREVSFELMAMTIMICQYVILLGTSSVMDFIIWSLAKAA